MAPERNNRTFSLNDYDCVGFDMDHTLLKYNIKELNTLVYDCLAKTLTEEYGYDKSVFPGDQISAQFIQRGLFIDKERGNFLKLGSSTEILRVAHGTQVLPRKSVENIYGKGATWPLATEFMKNSKSTSYKAGNICFTEFIYAPIYLLCAHLIDHFDQKGETKYTFWDDIMSVLDTTFSVDALGKSAFCETLVGDFSKYAEERAVPMVREFLRRLQKAGKPTFLLTAAPPTYSYATNAKYFGKDWSKNYDFTCNLFKKPGVFEQNGSESLPFVKSTGKDDVELSKDIESVHLSMGGLYTGGNFDELYEFFKRETKKENPKVVYFGDDFLNDLFGAGGKAKNCDAVGIIDELAECYVGGGEFSWPTLYAGDSRWWGSLFYDTTPEGKRVQTFWGQVLTNNTKMLAPSVECFASMPLDHKFRYPNISGVSKGSA